MRLHLDTNIDKELRLNFANSSGVFVKDGQNLGSGVSIFAQKNAFQNLEFRTLLEGSGIQLVESASGIIIDSTIVDDLSNLQTDFDNASGNWVETASNQGLGIGTFIQKVGADLQFRKILGGSGIEVSSSGNTIILDNELVDDFSELKIDFLNSSGVFIKNGENVGLGSNVFAQKSGQNLQFRRLLPGSGIKISTSGNTLRIDNTLEDDVKSVSDIVDTIINNTQLINSITSGVVSKIFFDLPLHGDDDDLKHTTIHSLPVAEMKDFESSKWNLISPLEGASGVFFRFTWFPEVTASGEIKFDLTLTQLPSGVDVSTASTVVKSLNLSESWVMNKLYIHEIIADANILGLQVISLKFERKADSYTGKVRNISYAVKYR